MASVVNDLGGRKRILFVDSQGDRKTIRLGKIDRRSADAIARHVEALLSSKIGGQPVPRDTASWLANIGDKLHGKLSALGLCALKQSSRETLLREFIEGYIEQRQDAKPSTVAIYRVCLNHLMECFGENRTLESITTADADQFKSWLISERQCSRSTVAKWVRVTRQFYNKAIQRKLVTENPFKHLSGATVGDASRRQYVPAQDIEALMEYLPDHEWRLFVALGRYAGLRLPSEIQSLRWADVNWERKRFSIIAPKTKHHADGGYRVCPIFPELVRYFQEAYDMAPDGAEFVFSERFRNSANHRTMLKRYIQRAGMQPWMKLLQNLRVSCATDLAQRHPSHVCTAWLGHDESIANKFYRQVQESDYQKAAQKAAQSTSEMIGGIVNNVQYGDEKTLDFLRVSEHGSMVNNRPLGATGLEQPLLYPAFSEFSPEGGAKSGALDAELSLIVERWPSLPRKVKDTILRMIDSGQQF